MMERLSRIVEEIRDAKLRGTVGEKILLGGIIGNAALVTVLIGSGVSGNDEATKMLKDFVALPAHATFDVIGLAGVFKLRFEANRGIENFLFHKRKSETE